MVIKGGDAGDIGANKGVAASTGMDPSGPCPAAGGGDQERRQFLGAGAFHAVPASLVDLARLFSVSTDYLLGVETENNSTQ